MWTVSDSMAPVIESQALSWSRAPRRNGQAAVRAVLLVRHTMPIRSMACRTSRFQFDEKHPRAWLSIWPLLLLH